MGGNLETEIMQKCKVNYCTARMIGNQARKNLAVSRWVSYSQGLLEEGLRIHRDGLSSDNPTAVSTRDQHHEQQLQQHSFIDAKKSAAQEETANTSNSERAPFEEDEHHAVDFKLHLDSSSVEDVQRAIKNIPDVEPLLSHRLRQCKALLKSKNTAAAVHNAREKKKNSVVTIPSILPPQEDERSTDTGGLGDFWIVPVQDTQSKESKVRESCLTFPNNNNTIETASSADNSKCAGQHVRHGTSAITSVEKNSGDLSTMSSMSSSSGTFIFCDNTLDSSSSRHEPHIVFNKNSTKKTKTTSRSGTTTSLAAYFRRLNKCRTASDLKKNEELLTKTPSSSELDNKNDDVDSITSIETDSDIDSGCSNLILDIMAVVGQSDRSVGRKESDDISFIDPGTLRLRHAKDTIDASCGGVLDTEAPKCPQRLSSLVQRKMIVPIKIKKIKNRTKELRRSDSSSLFRLSRSNLTCA